MYRPLKKGLKIKTSCIEGQGLISEIDIEKGENLGISHIQDDSGLFNNNLIRTPLGGFINHSCDPNCLKIKEGKYYFLKTKKKISSGDELTLNYTLYKCGDNQKI